MLLFTAIVILILLVALMSVGHLVTCFRCRGCFGDPLAALGIVQASLSSALVCTGVLRGEAHKRSAERSLCTLGRAHSYFKRSV